MTDNEFKYKRRSRFLFLLLIASIVGFYLKGVYMDAESRKEVKELNKVIREIKKDNESLSKEIKDINKSLKVVDDNINKLEAQKTIIKEIYHEKINSVNNYTDAQLDSFYSNRYGYDKN